MKLAAGHIDVSFHDGVARLDQPLDNWVSRSAPDAPAGADLTHFRRYLWFGLAVKPEHQGHGLGFLLLNDAVARLRAAGVRTLFIRATESSRGFYEGRFGSRVRFIEPEDAGDGETLYRLEIDLR
ncbi:MAG: GNAT family N-acetyltransferase [Elusimicrobia bacterium]|nr:GNAT family N-acetyltransferase [Elusimicrobiota bacterium]